MAGDPRVLGLLEEMLSSGKTPEEVCRHCPELLPEVRRRWQQFQLVDAQVRSLLPGLETSSDAARPRRRRVSRPHPRPSAVTRCGAPWGRAASAPCTSATIRNSTGPWPSRCCTPKLRPGAGRGERPCRRRGGSPSCATPASWRSTTWACTRGRSTSSRITSTAPTSAGGWGTTARPGRRRPGSRPPWPTPWPTPMPGSSSTATSSRRTSSSRRPRPRSSWTSAWPSTRPGRAAPKGVVSGTPCYMSPEQAPARPTASTAAPTSTAWAWCFTRCSCGRLPFRATDRQELLRQVRDDEPQPPRQLVREIPPELERVCLKALAKRQQDRYTTAGDFAEDLRRVLPTGRSRS